MGAEGRFITLSSVTEFVALGFIAGSIGSTGALITAWLLATQVLDISYQPDWLIPLTGTLVAIAGVVVTGTAAIRRSHKQAVSVGLGQTP